MISLNGKFANVDIFTDNVEDETISQLTKIINNELTEGSTIKIMPDCHAGKGCVIGTTMTINDKVVPNLLGVDLSCGMLTIKLPKHDFSEEELKRFDKIIYKHVPAGFGVHTASTNEKRWEILTNDIDKWFETLHCHSMLSKKHIKKSLGSLGGGNHFIELSKDSNDDVYLIIHTGSRYLGKQVAEYYQDLAYKTMVKDVVHSNYDLVDELIKEGRSTEIDEELKKLSSNIDKDLAYLTGELMKDYLEDCVMINDFANANRYNIAIAILENFFGNVCFNNGEFIVNNEVLTSFMTIHNYYDKSDHIIRKGAISAKKDELILIPINMRDGSILAKGKGNPDWNYSAPHGAGRILSRSSARNKLSLEDFVETMTGIYSTSISVHTLDESPFAYKPIEEIVNNIKDTAEIIDILKPIYNFKA